MTILRKGLLGLILVVAVSVVAGPVLAVALFGAAIVGLFTVAVVLWGAVLLGERWVNEGLAGYGIFEALDDSLEDVGHLVVVTILGLRPSAIAASFRGLVARFVLALPLLRERARVIAVLPIFPFVVLLGVFVEGYRVVRKDLVGTGQAIKDSWAGAYL